MTTEELLMQNEAAQKMLRGTRKVGSFPYLDDQCVLYLKINSLGDRLYYGWSSNGRVTLMDIELPQLPDMFEPGTTNDPSAGAITPVKQMRIEEGKKIIMEELGVTQ